MQVNILHNETRFDGHLAIFTRPDESRIAPGDSLYYVGTLEFEEADSPESAADMAFEAGNSPSDSPHALTYRSWHMRSLCVGDVVAVEDDNGKLTTLACQAIGWAPIQLSDYRIVGAATISLTITNRYELYDDVTTRYDVLVPGPPNKVVSWRLINAADGNDVASGEVAVFGIDDYEARQQAARRVAQHPSIDSQIAPAVRLGGIRNADPERDWADWIEDHIHPYTGAGRPDGDAWYDIHITDSSNPELKGRTFDWGY